MSKEQSVAVKVHVTPEVAAAVVRIAKHNDRSVSSLLRRWIREGIDREPGDR